MKDVYVTQPSLPPLEEFIPYLEEIWANRQLTNNGPFHHRFESSLAAYLNVDHLSLFTNGTLALVTALQALRITGEVITTPYTFPATAHALLWNGITPVFADISRDSFNLDPQRIEEAITPKTTAILPVHVYGYPCQTHEIQTIADNYGLKVIYDAAHTFGVRMGGKSLCAYGDISILSFHATKVFNTFEGGAIICPDEKTKKRVDYLKNFGFANETTVVAPGINGKMSEFQSALGVLQLNHIDSQIAERKKLTRLYRHALSNIPGIECVKEPENSVHNYAYFPILVHPEFRLTRDQLYEALRTKHIFPRRYFFPLLSDLPMYRGLASANEKNLPAAQKMTEQILCLPLFSSMDDNIIQTIAQIISGS